MAPRALALSALAIAAASAAACGSTSRAAPVTFNTHVAPLVYTNCAPCHRPGGVAPFPLLGYADVVKHADGIVEETRARRMPPWLPEASEFPILGERRLTPEQIETIARWVQEGKVEGDAAKRPPPPVFTDGWELGRPDVVLSLERPFTVRPGTEDVYRNLVLRSSLPTPVFVRAVEFKTNGAPIHHAVIRVDRTTTSRRHDGEDGQPGFDGMAWQNVHDPDGHFIGWAPGRGPILSPDGMPWRLERGADLVVEVHVIPTEAAATIQPTVGLFLTDSPPKEVPLTVRMGSKLIDIPAGTRDYVVTDTYVLPVPVKLLSVYPHAHYLARDMRFTATLPDGATKTLLHIPEWSFHWQQDYRYVTPIALPRGTRLTMRYTYDNSAENEENPHDPPVRVRAGPKSTDEMAEFGLQLLPQSAADAERLIAEFDERDMRANIAMAEERVRETPSVAEYRALLGGMYVEAGRPADAIPHLQEALRLGDRSGETLNYLGVALMERGRIAQALTYFLRAAAAAPRDERIHYNAGNALDRLRRPAEAMAAYERALAVNPDFPDAHVNLAVLLFSRRRVADALRHYERATELEPDSAVIHTNFGGALAGAGRYAEAMQHIRRALQIDPQYGPAIETFQRLQRMGIR